ncbi:hypothetical protein ACSBR1_037903 [Camellia fascicularis]
MKARRQIASDMQDIKARVIDIAHRRPRHFKKYLKEVRALGIGVLALMDQGRVDQWELVNRSFRAEVEGSDMNKIFFPEDHLIEWMSSIWSWIVEGFVEVKEGKTLEEVAEAYLFELLNSSIQVEEKRTDGIIKRCRVTLEEGTLPHLETLNIYGCNLEELPSGIKHQSNLYYLDLCNMSDILISKLNRNVQGEEYL